MNPPLLRRCLLVLACFVSHALADPAVPGNILDPKTAAEAWNVIGLTMPNVDKLAAEKRWAEIPTQISFCSPALRALAKAKGSPEVTALTTRAGGWVVTVARASQEGNGTQAIAAIATLHNQLSELGAHFDSATVAAKIFFCPMHPDFIADKAETPCAKCSMTLLPRRIPYSFVYMTPGKPSMQITAVAGGPLEPGRPAHVKVQLTHQGGAPVRPDDLLVMHTQPIHLLIEDPSLGDYHHEHPVATGEPGEYAFSFTPAKSGPYRIWADLVPTATGVQELPFVDLPGTGAAGAIEDKGNTFTTTSGGLTFNLTFGGGTNVLPRAQQACGLEITITEADGSPVKSLEPLMSAFAHLVGFYDDYETVVHLHPGGGEILRDDLRGGPRLIFTFFPPRPGFIRLYCQIQLDGKNIFAPFNLNVEP
jgi:hypothetical protein